MNKIWLYLSLILILLAIFSFADVKDRIPPKPNPPRLVNDFKGILAADQIYSLEQKLVAFSDSTSTQIAIVTVDTTYGYSASEFAYTIGDVWGVGGPNQDNGIVILLVLPRTDMSYREAFLATGRGTEGVITDATAGKIVRNIMIPYFQSDDYYGGLNAATDAIMKLTRGEFVDELQDETTDSRIPFIIIIIVIIIIIFAFNRINRGGGGMINRRGTFFPPWWIWSGMGGSGSGRGWSGGSSWGGGGGGGGFGGFGGGSFGGGGAGGRW